MGILLIFISILSLLAIGVAKFFKWNHKQNLKEYHLLSEKEQNRYSIPTLPKFFDIFSKNIMMPIVIGIFILGMIINGIFYSRVGHQYHNDN